MSPTPKAVIGLDMSANSTGVVVLRGTQLELAQLIQPGCTGPERLHEIYLALKSIAVAHGPFEIAVREDYAVGATNRPYLLGEVGGIAQVAVFSHTARIAHCAPKSLKKFATGNASASKGEVMDAVERRYGFCTIHDDLADAYALARVGLCLIGLETPTDRAALEALEVLRPEYVRPKKARSSRRAASVTRHDLEG